MIYIEWVIINQLRYFCMIKLFVALVLLLSTSAFQITQKIKLRSGRDISYPIRAVYIDRSQYWYGDNIAIALGVPGYAPPHIYNYVLLAFWSCNNNPQDMAGIWTNAYQFFGPENSFGNSTKDIQKVLRKKYNEAGIKIMVSAFGATQFPTSYGYSAQVCADKLAQYVIANNLDGADIDWEDNEAMKKGTGEAWLITFTQILRAKLPNSIISHAPQAPYFKNQYYPNGGYKTVNDKVGDMIDFYLIQFYNQVDSRYDCYEELFVHATGQDFNGTAIKEIVLRGVPLKKLVIGKPILPSDATNTGWIEMSKLGQICAKGFDEFGWFAGIMHWQYPSDKTGAAIVTAAGPLMQKCKQTQRCH